MIDLLIFVSTLLGFEPATPRTNFEFEVLEGVSTYFSNVYRLFLKEMNGHKGSKVPGLTSLAAGPIPLKNAVVNKNGGVFGDFAGAQKVEDSTKSKHFFAVKFQITSTFI